MEESTKKVQKGTKWETTLPVKKSSWKNSSGKNFVGEKYSPGKNFAGEKFRHLPKISSLFPDEFFPDKVWLPLK